MDRQLLKAYLKVMVEEEVKRLLPELLAEAIAEIKQATPLVEQSHPKPKVDRARLAELMGIDYDRDSGTLRAGASAMSNSAFSSFGTDTPTMLTTKDEAGNTRHIPANQVDPTVVNALTKDYSELMKRLKL